MADQQQYMSFSQSIHGGAGKAVITLNGQKIELFELKSLSARVEKNKSDGKTMGRLGQQYKSEGFKCSGKMEVYYISNTFRELMYEYMNTGRDVFFDIFCENTDASSDVTNPDYGGSPHQVALFNCNIDEATLMLLDNEESSLSEEIPFTFEYATMLSKFGEIPIR